MSGLSDFPSEPPESSGRALKLQTDAPHLVNIGGDRLSTSVTLYPIPQGSRVTLGCGPGVDIPVQGTGVLPLHCHIENSEGVVTIYPLSENLSVDGVRISKPMRLSQGVMLTIGRSNYMRFNHPAEAKIMKSVLPNPRMSMATITLEPENIYQQKLNKRPPAVPKKNPKDSLEDPSPSSIMTKVSKFEYLAQQNIKKCISPKVFLSNSVTMNTPAKDVLGKSPPNLEHLTKNLPQNALNYSELNYNEKSQSKAADRSIFGKKSPQYVNVSINETGNVNNKVIIYEHGCIPKSQNKTHNNELNNQTCNKNNNINTGGSYSLPNYNTCRQYRSVTPSPVSNVARVEHRRSGSMSELNNFLEISPNQDAEVKRVQAQQERIKEQEMGKAEKARLEEILNMCVEYEKQAQCEKNKVTPNRIKTNGSLPRDRRQFGNLYPAYATPPPSPLDVEFDNKRRNHSYENVVICSSERLNTTFDHCDEQEAVNRSSPYENILLNDSNIPPHHSPRTRIKTIATSNRENKGKETADIVENKFAILEKEQYLIQNLNVENEQKTKQKEEEKNSNLKFIFPLSEPPIIYQEATRDNSPNKTDSEKSKIEKSKRERKQLLGRISAVKRQIADSEILEEELQRDAEMENALLSGEHKAKMLEAEKLQRRKDKLVACAHKLEGNMENRQAKQVQDQLKCKRKLEEAQANTARIEEKLSRTSKKSLEYEELFEEYLKAQEVLDNERKAFEDLEFHHLEEEADWLASREEVQREIVDLSGKIDVVSSQLQELEQQKYNMTKNTSKETSAIRKQRQELLKNLEIVTNLLKAKEIFLSTFSNQESDMEESSDTDSDLDTQLSVASLNVIQDLSHSVVVSDTKNTVDHFSNMSQSFNEKLLQEKSVLEGAIVKYPSQDDIDRISKVTANAPISIDEEQQSLGRKTIESLKDIERKRHLHLCQQASQVIENERQRVLALKQKAQREVHSKWAQDRQFAGGEVGYSEFTEGLMSKVVADCPTNAPEAKTPPANVNESPSSEPGDLSRPLSEISEVSTDFGTNLGRKRNKSQGDKQRPLTRYLPIRGSDLDLRQHIESAGHQVVLCPHVIINSSSCKGFLHKKGSKLNGWSKKWFVFDRNKHTLTYYNDKSEKKPRGGAYFQAIEEVYLDHLNSVKSPNQQLTFIVKTHQRFYYLMAPSLEAMRIWVDVVFTGAEGYRAFENET